MRFEKFRFYTIYQVLACLVLHFPSSSGRNYVIASVTPDGFKELRVSYNGVLFLETSVLDHGAGNDIVLLSATDGRQLAQTAAKHRQVEGCVVSSAVKGIKSAKKEFFKVRVGRVENRLEDVMDFYHSEGDNLSRKKSEHRKSISSVSTRLKNLKIFPKHSLIKQHLDVGEQSERCRQWLQTSRDFLLNEKHTPISLKTQGSTSLASSTTTKPTPVLSKQKNHKSDDVIGHSNDRVRQFLDREEKLDRFKQRRHHRLHRSHRNRLSRHSKLLSKSPSSSPPLSSSSPSSSLLESPTIPHLSANKLSSQTSFGSSSLSKAVDNSKAVSSLQTLPQSSSVDEMSQPSHGAIQPSSHLQKKETETHRKSSPRPPQLSSVAQSETKNKLHNVSKGQNLDQSRQLSASVADRGQTQTAHISLTHENKSLTEPSPSNGHGSDYVFTRGKRMATLVGKKRVPRSKRDLFTGWVVFPGTKWCGDGDIADHKHDLGYHTTVDRCCRRHDLCQLVIPRLSRKYGMFNYRLHTLSHCRCDRKFRKCLQAAATPVAHLLGKIYFNIIGPKCFKFKQEKSCVKRHWWGSCKLWASRKVAYPRRQRKFKPLNRI